MTGRHENPYKKFVEVLGTYNFDGSFRPYRFRTEEGRTMKIDHVSDVREAASLRCGGQGVRYTCRVKERAVYLFHETHGRESHWFVEAAGH